MIDNFVISLAFLIVGKFERFGEKEKTSADFIAPLIKDFQCPPHGKFNVVKTS